MGFLSKFFGSSEPGPNEVDVATTVSALSDPNIQVIDCRSKSEWNAGHIDGAKLIPLDMLGKRMNELDKTRPVIVVCRSGSRSMRAVRSLNGQGFVDAKSMKGGVNAWSRAGNALVS